jgi:hypothetical protein
MACECSEELEKLCRTVCESLARGLKRVMPDGILGFSQRAIEALCWVIVYPEDVDKLHLIVSKLHPVVSKKREREVTLNVE